MTTDDYASYEESSFCIDASKLHFNDLKDKNGEEFNAICEEDFPSLMHEWWHFVQDVATLSARNGFYLWMRDMVRLSQIFMSGEGKVIHIPLPKDQYGEPVSKDRSVFNILARPNEKPYRIDKAKITDIPSIDVYDLEYEDASFKNGVCRLFINNKEYYFGLTQLQEINCRYFQKIVEQYDTSVVYNNPADDLPTYPYQLGDLIFDYYNVDTDLRSKFVITFCCLNTIHAPETFLYVVQKMGGLKLRFDKDKEKILTIIASVKNPTKDFAIRAETAFANDFQVWIKSNAWTNEFREALKWYVITTVKCMHDFADYYDGYYAELVSSSKREMMDFCYVFQSPLIKYNGIIHKLANHEDDQLLSQSSYDSALYIWSCRRVYELLTKKDSAGINEVTPCVLKDGCIYKEKVGNDYYCATCPWELAKGVTTTKCPYILACMTMGLAQNSIEIDL